jgi:serine acetyltransferase
VSSSEETGDVTPPAVTDIELTTSDWGFWRLVWSDYEASAVEHRESHRIMLLKLVPRFLFNPSLQLAFLFRLATKGPAWLLFPVRWLLIVMFNCEASTSRGSERLVIGPGVTFPHPVNILIGPTEIGAGVTIYNNTTFGSNRHVPSRGVGSGIPRIGDRAVIYGYTSVQGQLVIGHDAVVGTRVALESDVPPGALRTYRGQRPAGEWAGEGRERWRMPAI